MTFTYSFPLTSSTHKVRNYIGDTDETNYDFHDEEIAEIITSKGGDLFSAAAMCLRRIAASKVKVARRRRIGDYEEDTRQIITGLIAAAKSFEDMANSIPSEAETNEIYTDFNYRELIRNQILRGEEI